MEEMVSVRSDVNCCDNIVGMGKGSEQRNVIYEKQMENIMEGKDVQQDVQNLIQRIRIYEMGNQMNEKIVVMQQQIFEQHVCEYVEMGQCDMEKSAIMMKIMDVMEYVHLSVRRRKIRRDIVEMGFKKNEKNVIYEVRMGMHCVIESVGYQL